MIVPGDIKTMLMAEYALSPESIFPAPGGFSTKAAYRVIDTTMKEYFLKVYDRSLPTTRVFVERIDVYMPVLKCLSMTADLRGRVLTPIQAKSGAYKVERNSDTYALYEFVDGTVPGINGMTPAQTVELAEILARLHETGMELVNEAGEARLHEASAAFTHEASEAFTHEASAAFANDAGAALAYEAGAARLHEAGESNASVLIDTSGLDEDISLSFCESLARFLESGESTPADLRRLVSPHADMLKAAISATLRLRDTIRKGYAPLVLCHGDAHGNNVIQSARLVLADWEGLHLAPAEADLFIYAWHTHGELLLRAYSDARGGYQINRDMLYYYVLRRRIEDVWVDIQRLTEEDPDEAAKTRLLSYVSQGIGKTREAHESLTRGV